VAYEWPVYVKKDSSELVSADGIHCGGSSKERVFKDSPEASTDMSKTATASLDFAEFLQESLGVLKRNWRVIVLILQILI